MDKQINKMFSYELMKDVTDTIEGLSFNKKYEQGYIEELDLVNISPNGYIGRVVEIRGLLIGLPKKLHTDKVLYSDLPVEEQKWERPKEPNFSSDEQKEKYIEKQYKHRFEGRWVSIQGNEMYLTGDNVFYISHFVDQGKVMDFRYADVVYFYAWRAVELDDRCFGIIFGKGRRSGWTARALSIMINKATSSYFSNFGLMSKKSSDSQKTYRRRLVPSFRKLPDYFKPQLKNPNIDTSMYFDTPASRKIGGKVEDTNGLNTSITYETTSLDSFDQDAVTGLVLDEVSKYPKDVPFSEFLDRVVTTLREGGQIVGKVQAGSTYDAAIGGEEFKKVWYDSNIDKRDSEGWTKSGLYSFFTPIQYNYNGYIDEYGFPIIEDPEEPMLNNLGKYISKGYLSVHESKVEKLKDDIHKLLQHYHQNPMTEEQMFTDVSGNSLIDLIKANEQIRYIESSESTKPIIGEFVWSDPNPDRTDLTVEFIPSPQGSFRVYWMPPPELRNNHVRKNGKVYPANTNLISLATDPHKVDKTVDNRASNTAVQGMTLPNMNEKVPEGFTVAFIYNNREKTVAETVDKVIRVTLFYSAENLVENNVDNVIKEFYNRGLTQFVARRPDKPKLNDNEKRYGGIPNNSENIRQLTSLYISDYGTKYIGQDIDNGNVKTFCMDKEVVVQLMKYDPYDRTKDDLGIVHGLNLLNIHANLSRIKKQQSKPKRKVVKEYSFSKKTYSY